MDTLRTTLSTAFLAMALGVAPPAMAQHHGGGGHGSGRSESHSAAAPRAQAPAPAPAPRADGARQNYSVNNNWRGGTAVPGASAVPRTYSPSVRGQVYANSGYRNYGSAYRNYGYHGSYYYAPVHFYHPYYSFHPHFSVGFGLWVGYPVPYAYAYYNPFYYGAYPYAYPYPSAGYPPSPYPDDPSSPYPSSPYPSSPYPSSGYPPSGYPPSSSYPQSAPDPNTIGVQPGQANMGGLSFEITPNDATVLVDGNFVGTVGQFTPSTQPLGLPAGRHHVEVRAQGYRTISLDVDIVAGQVTPYQGTMERR